ncbi:hypothetical protein D3C80_979140 [compost metagenome]
MPDDVGLDIDLVLLLDELANLGSDLQRHVFDVSTTIESVHTIDERDLLEA